MDGRSRRGGWLDLHQARTTVRLRAPTRRARQGLIAARRAEQANRAALYKVLGGEWKE
jgi:hypothetical protein